MEHRKYDGLIKCSTNINYNNYDIVLKFFWEMVLSNLFECGFQLLRDKNKGISKKI